MKKKEIIVTTLVTIVLVGGTVGYKLLSKDTSTKVNVKQEDNKSITIKDMTGEKPKSSDNSKKIDYKKMYSEANKDGNTDSNFVNGGLIAQQGELVYFGGKGIYMSLADLKTGCKKITDDSALDIQVIGDWIYYINKSRQLIRIKADGSGKTIINKLVDLYQIKNNYIYCIEGKQLFKMKLDGTDKCKVMENQCTGASVKDDVIYYINNSDGKLHKVFTDGSCDESIAADQCFTFVAKGDWIYYLTKSGLYKVKPDGTSSTKVIEEFISFNIDNEYIYYAYSNRIDSTIEVYRVKLDGTEKTKIYSLKNNNKKEMYTSACEIYTTSENVYLFMNPNLNLNIKGEQCIYILKK